MADSYNDNLVTIDATLKYREVEETHHFGDTDIYRAVHVTVWNVQHGVWDSAVIQSGAGEEIEITQRDHGVIEIKALTPTEVWNPPPSLVSYDTLTDLEILPYVP